MSQSAFGLHRVSCEVVQMKMMFLTCWKRLKWVSDHSKTFPACWMMQLSTSC